MTQFRLHGVGQCRHAPGQFLAQYRAPGAVRVGGDHRGAPMRIRTLAQGRGRMNRSQPLARARRGAASPPTGRIGQPARWASIRAWARPGPPDPGAHPEQTQILGAAAQHLMQPPQRGQGTIALIAPLGHHPQPGSHLGADLAVPGRTSQGDDAEFPGVAHHEQQLGVPDREHHRLTGGPEAVVGCGAVQFDTQGAHQRRADGTQQADQQP